MIDFTDAPKLKKGYGGANGNKISILLNGSRWMLKFPSISERSPELHYTKGCISEYIGSHISFSQLALALKILYWVRIL